VSTEITSLAQWLTIPPEELNQHSSLSLTILDTPSDVHQRFADDMFAEFETAARDGEEIAVVVPVGPKGQYAILAERINSTRLSLEHVTFFGMDNWLDWQGRSLPLSHAFNLEGFFRSSFINALTSELRPRDVIFPSPANLESIVGEIQRRGGISTTYAGFGFQGHIAFNEPPANRWIRVTLDQFRESTTRILPLSVDTIIAHSQRSAGGNVFAVPPMAVTLGMRELLGARKLRLYTDGGAWKQTILRILLFAPPTVDYPVTLVRDHPDVHIVVDSASAACPAPLDV
jgi:glucosamine-6-phosphate deaminase